MDKSVHKNSRLCRYSALKEVEHTFPALVCLPRGNSLRREKGNNFEGRNLKNITSARWSRLKSTVISHIDSMSPRYDANGTLPLYFTSGRIVRKTFDKDIRQNQLRDSLQNTWPLLFKTIKAIRNKGSLINCNSQQEP